MKEHKTTQYELTEDEIRIAIARYVKSETGADGKPFEVELDAEIAADAKWHTLSNFKAIMTIRE